MCTNGAQNKPSVNVSPTMDSRREFLKKAALLAAGGSVAGAFPVSISRALAIDPTPGSTFLDAEHVVILMQENRSFDHAFGTLRGVRGFNDPRAITLPDGNPVWVQTNARGEQLRPVPPQHQGHQRHLDRLPAARLDRPGRRPQRRPLRPLARGQSAPDERLRAMPLTLGYYTREDIPFYYALADAFTICDQHFCSALTGTTPNRLYLWTRHDPREARQRRIAGTCATRKRIYDTCGQLDDVSRAARRPRHLVEGLPERTDPRSGLERRGDAWLANFGDNPLEYFTQFNVRFAQRHRRHLEQQARNCCRARSTALKAKPRPWTADSAWSSTSCAPTRCDSRKRKRELRAMDAGELRQALRRARRASTPRRSPRTPATRFRQLAELDLPATATRSGRCDVPKGDVFHQFRKDVRTGKLPTVSWLVAPERFSDHPGSPWYGAWYIAEALDILTQNPGRLEEDDLHSHYDENDGYFDHVPPFVAPHPGSRRRARRRPGSTQRRVRRIEQEMRNGRSAPRARRADRPRLPRADDHRLALEPRRMRLLAGVRPHVARAVPRKIRSRTRRAGRSGSRTSPWRRTVCGDLTSVFRPVRGREVRIAQAGRVPALPRIHRPRAIPPAVARSGFKKLEPDADIELARHPPREVPVAHTPGKRSRAPHARCPTNWTVDGALDATGNHLRFRFAARPDDLRGTGRRRTVPCLLAGSDASPAFTPSRPATASRTRGRSRTFRTAPITFACIGPNGFFREFRGTTDDPPLEIALVPVRRDGTLTGNVLLTLANRDATRTFTARVGGHGLRNGKAHRIARRREVGNRAR